MNTQTTGPWRKSSFSGANGNCVEFAPTTSGVAVRDSKDPAWATSSGRPDHAWTCRCTRTGRTSCAAAP
jgi:uncharacterized protein DUF397